MKQVKSAPTPPSWHNVSAKVSLENLHTSVTGLEPDEAIKRLTTHGPNQLPQPIRRNAFMRLLLQFHNILIYVLITSAMITGMLEHWIDTSVILAVVIANAIIGFIQEGKAEQAMNAIRHMLALCALSPSSGWNLPEIRSRGRLHLPVSSGVHNCSADCLFWCVATALQKLSFSEAFLVGWESLQTLTLNARFCPVWCRLQSRD